MQYCDCHCGVMKCHQLCHGIDPEIRDPCAADDATPNSVSTQPYLQTCFNTGAGDATSPLKTFADAGSGSCILYSAILRLSYVQCVFWVFQAPN